MLYLDHAATTPVLPEALQEAWPFLTTDFGNPSSTHDLGRVAHDALEDARGRVARALGARAGDIVFTSGGTEGDNLGVAGLALANPRGRHLVTAPTEHEAVVATITYLERMHGFDVTWLPVDRDGRVSAESLTRALREDTTLVSLMLVNNEVGTVHPVAEFARKAREVGALMHTDAVQALGWIPVNVQDLGVDALTLSGHKLGAPKGSGAVFIRSGLALEPLLHGGGQERERRSGTENVAWARALATAIEAADAGASHPTERPIDEFIRRVLSTIPEARLSGPPVDAPDRSPGIASFTFPGWGGETILLELERRGIVASSGAACAAGRDEPSHVLLACGYSEDEARTSVRFSISRATSHDDLALTALALRGAVDAVAGRA